MCVCVCALVHVHVHTYDIVYTGVHLSPQDRVSTRTQIADLVLVLTMTDIPIYRYTCIW